MKDQIHTFQELVFSVNNILKATGLLNVPCISETVAHIYSFFVAGILKLILQHTSIIHGCCKIFI